MLCANLSKLILGSFCENELNFHKKNQPRTCNWIVFCCLESNCLNNQVAPQEEKTNMSNWRKEEGDVILSTILR